MLKFMYNGIKLNGKLYKGNYSKGGYTKKIFQMIQLQFMQRIMMIFQKLKVCKFKIILIP